MPYEETERRRSQGKSDHLKSDHDLLITVNERMNILMDDFNDFKKRIAMLETALWRIVGAFGCINVIIVIAQFLRDYLRPHQ